ncbi:MAG: 3-dehydroquinate synthase [Bacteroidota bacterium]
MENLIKSTGYEIHLGAQSLHKLDSFLTKKKYSKIFILCDENTFNHCLPELLYQCSALHEAELLEIESGEENKNLNICADLLRSLTESEADRRALMLNLGGGVIGDLGGFTASVYKRGIDFINVPTTLLAMADASVGGKTGVDLDGVKNQVGVFSNPSAVIIYPRFLETLPERELLSGFAEIIKSALIADEKFFTSLSKLRKISAKNLLKYIQRSVEIKNDIVKKDPTEISVRKALNFGHTIGHALESFYLKTSTSLLHGEAVALGMLAEAYLSKKLNFISSQELIKIQKVIHRFYGFEHFIVPDMNALLQLMKQDKKNQDGKIKFSLLQGIGKSKIDCEVPIDLILESINTLWPELN